MSYGEGISHYEAQSLAEREARESADSAKRDAEYYTDTEVRKLREDLQSDIRGLRSCIDELREHVYALQSAQTGNP